jgi:hypothetical protein
MDSHDDKGKSIQFWSTKNSREYWARRRFYDRRAFFVNCWHIDKYESAAMWSVYAPAGHGVAIVANYSRLVDAMAKTNERIFAATVEYVDFVTEPVNTGVIFPISKRRSFSYENELRLIHWDLNIQPAINNLCTKLASTMFRGVGQPTRTDEVDWDLIEEDVERVKYPNGHHIALDVEALISEVRISPTAEDWFVDLVRSVSTRYGLEARVTRSDLLSSPMR